MPKGTTRNIPNDMQTNKHATRKPTLPPDTDSPLNAFSIFNIQGLVQKSNPSKVPFIRDIITFRNEMFCALTETWLKDQKEAEIHIEGFTHKRHDRKRKKSTNRGRDSGGVLLYLRNDIATTAENIIEYSDGVIGILGIHIKDINLVIIVIYRQPDDEVNNHRSTSTQFGKAIKVINDALEDLPTPTPEIVLCGDFNLPHVQWPEGKCRTGVSTDERIMLEQITELANNHFLSQYICKATHIKGNTLDLIYTNNPDLIHSYNCVNVSSTISDHCIIEGYCKYNTNQKNKTSGKNKIPSYTKKAPSLNEFNFYSKDINWETIYQKLNDYDWKANLNGTENSDMMEKILSVCYNIVKDLVPKKAKWSNKKKSHIPRERKNLMRRRSRINHQLANKINSNKRDRLENERIDIEMKLQSSYRNENKEREKRACEAIKVNSKYFFSYAKTYSRVKIGIGPLLDAAKNIISCPLKIADMLSDQYNSVYSKPTEEMPSPEDIFDGTALPETIESLEDITFSVEDIQRAIDEISPTSAAGPDGFPAILLKACKIPLSIPLEILWRNSLDQGTIPQLFKTAHIVPIHKGGSKGESKNYRPVALTSHLIKVFEKVLRTHIIKHMEEHNLFNPRQHGFRMGRSCLSQLIAHFDNIMYELEQGRNVDVVYLDFSKAFDKVDFLITLRKINALGIKGKIGKWIQCFLTGRTQSVLVDGEQSKHSPVKSGVPQGSVLGPILFLILLGDIDQDILSSVVSSFADDSRVTKGITCDKDVENLQNDLESIYKWTIENNMALNDDKFECLRYGWNNDIKNQSSYKSNTGSEIEVKDHVKDLGIIMSSDCTFHEHISQTVDAAKSLTGWILRTFYTRSALPMLTLWKSLVLPKLDYCCILWNPTAKGQIQTIEMVQRTFLRKISTYRKMSYWDQLKAAKLYSVERRRERYHIIYVWKVLEGLVPNISEHEHRMITGYEHIRFGRLCKLLNVTKTATAHVKAARYASLGYRGPCLFNTVPAHIRNLTNVPVDEFKKELDKFLSTVPDEPQIPGYTMYRRADTNSIIDMVKLGGNENGNQATTSHSSGCPHTLED